MNGHFAGRLLLFYLRQREDGDTFGIRLFVSEVLVVLRERNREVLHGARHIGNRHNQSFAREVRFHLECGHVAHHEFHQFADGCLELEFRRNLLQAREVFEIQAVFVRLFFKVCHVERHLAVIAVQDIGTDNLVQFLHLVINCGKVHENLRRHLVGIDRRRRRELAILLGARGKLGALDDDVRRNLLLAQDRLRDIAFGVLGFSHGKLGLHLGAELLGKSIKRQLVGILLGLLGIGGIAQQACRRICRKSKNQCEDKFVHTTGFPG